MTRSPLAIACMTCVALICAGTAAASDIGRSTAVLSAISDPFGYCAGIGSIDKPAGGASPVPAALKPYLRRTLGLPTDSPFMPHGYYWRCMDGAVYVCVVGANIPCDVKADRARHNPGAENFCRDNPQATYVPAYATGHDTIFEWGCLAGSATRGKQIVTLDHRGYRSDIWRRVLREYP
jgi:hypothetical protein